MPVDPQLPNLLIAGAMRSGTTSAYRYLEAHPDIFMSPSKEPHFLAFEDCPPAYTGPGDDHLNQRVCTNLEEYRALFAPGASARVSRRGRRDVSLPPAPRSKECSDTTSNRSSSSSSATRPIAPRLPSSICGARAANRWRHWPKHSTPNRNGAALGWAPMWHYLAAGRFADQVTRWRDAIGADNLQVVLFEDLESSPGARSRRSSSGSVSTPTRRSTTWCTTNPAAPRSVAVERMTRRAGPRLRKIKRALPRPMRHAFERFREQNIVSRDGVDASTRARIVAEVADDVRRLEGIIERDLERVAPVSLARATGAGR